MCKHPRKPGWTLREFETINNCELDLLRMVRNGGTIAAPHNALEISFSMYPGVGPSSWLVALFSIDLFMVAGASTACRHQQELS